MADDSKIRMNLAAIRKVDPYANKIVGSSSHVALYTFDPEKNQWEKTNVEGAFFVFSREAPPIHSIFINNRLNTSTFMEPITKYFDLQIRPPFLLYRNEKDRIRGFWFYDSEECERMSILITNLVQTSNETETQDSANYSTPTLQKVENVNIFNMLSKAQEDYTNSEELKHQKMDAPHNVKQFIASASKSQKEKELYKDLERVRSENVHLPFYLPTERQQSDRDQLMLHMLHSSISVEELEKQQTPAQSSKITRTLSNTITVEELEKQLTPKCDQNQKLTSLELEAKQGKKKNKNKVQTNPSRCIIPGAKLENREEPVKTINEVLGGTERDETHLVLKDQQALVKNSKKRLTLPNTISVEELEKQLTPKCNQNHQLKVSKLKKQGEGDKKRQDLDHCIDPKNIYVSKDVELMSQREMEHKRWLEKFQLSVIKDELKKQQATIEKSIARNRSNTTSVEELGKQLILNQHQQLTVCEFEKRWKEEKKEHLIAQKKTKESNAFVDYVPISKSVPQEQQQQQQLQNLVLNNKSQQTKDNSGFNQLNNQAVQSNVEKDIMDIFSNKCTVHQQKATKEKSFLSNNVLKTISVQQVEKQQSPRENCNLKLHIPPNTLLAEQLELQQRSNTPKNLQITAVLPLHTATNTLTERIVENPNNSNVLSANNTSNNTTDATTFFNTVALNANKFQFSPISNQNDRELGVRQQLLTDEPSDLKTLLCGSTNDSGKPALLLPTMFDKPMLEASTNNGIIPFTPPQKKLQEAPLNQAQLVQAFSHLMHNDQEFVDKLHEAYLKVFEEN